jgi:hypothetical protein
MEAINRPDGDQRQIEHAVNAWARSTFSAPRRLGELVTNIEHRDEVIERVATHVVRRELSEMRTATSERRSTRARVDRASVDPFGHTHETLRADSEHVVPCGACAASGLMACHACRGTGNGHCPNCHGSGKERSAKTGRPINCKSCKATGVASCRHCAGRGSVFCAACAGSGHQLAWLTFQQTERWEVAVPTKSPVVLAHRGFLQARALSRAELTTVDVVDEQMRDGPLDLHKLAEADRPVVRAQLGRIDPRLERVVHQQFLKLAAIRRDVTFEMCGTRATLSLVGTALAGATTPEVLRPIRRRLIAWVVLCALVAFIGVTLRDSVLGSSRYFANARGGADTLIGSALICAIPVFGTLLRSWRGGLRFHPMHWPIKAWSAGVLVSLVAILVVGLLAQPAATEVQRALAENDVAKARAVIEALEERGGDSRDVQDLRDRVLLAEAGQAQGDERLRLLEAVAARQGTAAAGAAADARAQRLDTVRQLVATRHAADALALLDKSFAGDHSVPVAEERARAHEAAKAACTTAACRLGEALEAGAARPTPERTTDIEQAHAEALGALDPKRADAKDTLPRLRQLRQLRDAGAATANVAATDTALQAHAHDAIAFAGTERARVPLLTNTVAIAEELLEASAKTEGQVASIALDEGTVYLAIDRSGKCSGVYAIGAKDAARALKSKTWPPERLLSQAVGRPSVLQAASSGGTTSRWYAGGAAVTARWLAGVVVELRIGDATP